jgi:hypothetical protein
VTLVGDEARRLYRARPGTLILIRPDGYIAVRAADAETIDGHLTRTLAPAGDVVRSHAAR